MYLQQPQVVQVDLCARTCGGRNRFSCRVFTDRYGFTERRELLRRRGWFVRPGGDLGKTGKARSGC